MFAVGDGRLGRKKSRSVIGLEESRTTIVCSGALVSACLVQCCLLSTLLFPPLPKNERLLKVNGGGDFGDSHSFKYSGRR